MPQRREAAIVGIHEYPLRVVGPGTSALQIKAASAAKALWCHVSDGLPAATAPRLKYTADTSSFDSAGSYTRGATT